ncbi:MAG: phytanoyl-CoA dioxygenase family protein [Deltaproteobacteria bacterium]|nr:phytanoyl-CoA dioxygenase family protein [Deltaproteobacteria bacterium]
MEGAWCVDDSGEQVRRFQDQGFLHLGRMSSDLELAWLRTVYDEIVKKKTGYTPQELGWMSMRHKRGSLLTIPSPEQIAPELQNTSFYRNARQVFACFLGVEDTRLLSGWRIFCKPAHSGATPWHQDAAYRPPPHRSVSIWLSLDPATLESSCLSYIARSHRVGVIPHHFHQDHLVVDTVDPSQGIACPVLAGEALLHHCCTLHYAGSNTTSRSRRALAIVCRVTDAH